MPYTESGSSNVYPIFGSEGLPRFDPPQVDPEQAAKDLASILLEFDPLLDEQATVLSGEKQESNKHELAA